MGRFVSADSIVPDGSNPQDFNRYSYVQNNPVRYTDPSGHQIFEDEPDDPYFFSPQHSSTGEAVRKTDLRCLTNCGETNSIDPTSQALIGVACDICDIGFMLNAWGHGDFSGWDLIGLAPVVPVAAVRAIRKADRLLGACSFRGDTLVATRYGLIPISAISAGTLVLAYNEETGEIGYYPVTASWRHLDPIIVYLTISGEVIETTPEHPFYTFSGEWVPASALQLGDLVFSANGGYGVVEALQFVRQSEWMYNFTVQTAHTYFVGDGQWLVHNQCPEWVTNGRTLVSWAKRMEKSYKKNGSIPSVNELDELVNRAREYGVYTRLDGPHPGTPWNVPHLNIGGRSGKYHVPVPSDYTLP